MVKENSFVDTSAVVKRYHALDALQLAVTKHIEMRRGIDQFITAENLASCASLEGLAPVNPELKTRT